MFLQRYKLRWSFVILVLLAVTGVFVAGLQRLIFDTDLVASLPQDDPVLADARRIITNHPIQDRVVIDVGRSDANVDGLVDAARVVEKRLRESGLFARVGLEQEQQLIPELIFSISVRLAVLFSAEELEEEVKPLLDPVKIRRALSDHFAQLGQLESIGQTGFIAQDPLNLRNLIFSRLSHLAPAQNAQIYKGYLLSADKKHFLIVAEPLISGVNTTFARKVTALIDAMSRELNQNREGHDSVTLTPAGTFRAALDNETRTKQGTKRAVLFSTLAIMMLLLLAFPRPLIGLLALLPSAAGTMLALFVYSLFHPSITMMAIGFGSAIISFTVDYGITYLLFLDRPYETHGLEATREVWPLGLLAMLTTAVSFAFLAVTGFAALAQIGEFTALGVLFTYIFVHLIYPVIFPTMPPARGESLLPLQRFANWIATGASKKKAVAAFGLAVVLLFFANPVFHVDLNAMNSVSEETLAAEKLLADVWGNIFSRVYMMVEGRDIQELQQKGDRLATLLDQEVKSGTLASAFVPSLVFPGRERAEQNFSAWRAFWQPERVAALREALGRDSIELGFAPDAFAPFLTLVQAKEIGSQAIPHSFFGLLGISKSRDRSTWVQVSTLTPGPAYQGEPFYNRFKGTGWVEIFDSGLFSQRLADVLLSSFIKMVLIVGVMTLFVAFFYLLDWQLTLIGVLPTLFALICTIGTLNLLGVPLGIPTLMVAVVVIGMGSDYAFYLVRSYQRYAVEDHPSLGLIRLSVFLSFATTFMGFGALATSGHALLKNAGIALALGIGYSFIGAVTITPPLLRHVFIPIRWSRGEIVPGSKQHRLRAVGRYRHMEPYPRLFARFKILLDPMFPRLASFLDSPRTIIDIGCGYGVPAVWLLSLFPGAKVYGLDPDRRRVAIAARAFGDRGLAAVGKAPDLPPDSPDWVDAALMLDMTHLISNDELRLTLQRLYDKIVPEGRLILRTTVPSRKPVPWLRRVEEWRLKALHLTPHFRSIEEVTTLLSEAGFLVELKEPTALDREETWFICRRSGRGHG
ncbi:MAG TPA: methyltransferase domain-containing protein [Thermodesulfobacteriota bacterium]|nr:methyltransferase domain-containing protein [Thermodesulfobacteriota bacterium]